MSRKIPSQFFLFCNERYGARYEQVYRDYFSNSNTEYWIVRSAKRNYHNNEFYLIAQKILHKIVLFQKNRKSRPNRILYIENVNHKHFMKYIKQDAAGIVAGFNQIFHAPIISRFSSLYNFHPSILPYYRGPVPSYWCLQLHEKKTGITLHHINSEIDAGNILWQEVAAINSDDSPESLDKRLSEIGSKALKNLLEHFCEGKPFLQNHINADLIYRHKIGYRSFPK